MLQATQAGARLVKSAQPTFYGGYAGQFQDQDGHLWAVAINPGIASLWEKGSLIAAPVVGIAGLTIAAARPGRPDGKSDDQFRRRQLLYGSP